jgi:hypothetical protein
MHLTFAKASRYDAIVQISPESLFIETLNFIPFRMMNTSKLATLVNFKSCISNFKYLGACPEDLYFTAMHSRAPVESCTAHIRLVGSANFDHVTLFDE